MSRKLKKLGLSGALFTLVLVLSGCVREDASGQPSGMFYNVFVVPTQMFLDFVAQYEPGGYGMAIVILTILVRLIMLPLTLKQQRTMIEGQVKMAAVKDVTDEIQAELKETKDPHLQQSLYQEMQDIYKQIDYNPMSLPGCLPVLIQLPIISMVYQAIRLNPEIANSQFLGINLGQPSTVLAIIAGLVYLIQSFISYQNMPKETRGQMGATLFMSPIMIFIFSLSSSAGIAIYWIFGGILTLLQTLYSEYIYKPRVEEDVRAQMGDVNIVRKERPKKEDTLNATRRKQIKQGQQSTGIFEKKGRRNEGKQDR